MKDYFALLDEPRLPWLDTKALKDKFLKASSEVHPDRCHDAGAEEKARAQALYTELNAAHSCLSDSKSRLRHLLELQTGEAFRDIQQPPAELMDLFFEIGALCKETDSFLAEKDAAESPLIKVKFFEQGLERTDAVQKQIGSLSERITALDEKLQQLNPAWQTNWQSAQTQVEEICRLLSYYERWRGQLNDRFVRLAM
ncbi:MAG: hypothetical protein ACKVHO_19100 [Verrucomicrobiia bacterium]|jgi:DnaJ-domain-containing protein 1